MNPMTTHTGAFPARRHASASATAPSTGVWPLVLGNLLLGTIGVFVHEAGADPITATWFRCAFGLAGLSAWLLLRRQWSSLRLSRANALPVLSAAALIVVAWVLFFTAIQLTSAGVASLLFHVQPLWVLLLAAVLLKQQLARQRVVAVLVAMAGLVLATGGFEQFAASAPQWSTAYWMGVGLCLVGALCTAGVTLIASGRRAAPAGTLAWWQCALGTVVLLAWPLTHGWPAVGPAWAWLAGLGLIHTSLAYGLIYSGMARLPADRIAVLQFIYPATALLIDWVVYGYRLSGLQLAGVALVAAAIACAERRPKAD